MLKTFAFSTTAAIALSFFLTVSVSAKIITKVVNYNEGKTALEGYFVYNDAEGAKMPGVVLIHEWWGLNDYAKTRAEQLAGLGYAVFCADIYGKGVRAKTMDEAGKLAAVYRADRPLMRARAQAALDELKKQTMVDASRIAAMGYCFGGGAALELARSGAPILGTVCFHGNLDTPNPADAKNIYGKVLILQGADDTYTVAQVPAIQKEMTDAGVDWQMNIYSGAVHGFTNPANGSDNSKGLAYNEKADRRSWQAMEAFFKEVLAAKQR